MKRYGLADLLRALAGLLPKQEVEDAVIPRQEFPVQERMEAIRTALGKTRKGLDFRQLLGDRKNHSEIISTFLAVLELLRLKEIDLIQEEPFGPMVLEPRKEETHETDENR